MFEIGKEYRRASEIHGLYGGQQQGGISTPTKHPIIMLFTSDSGEQHGYKDEFKPDGVFWYTGEGQEGDMKMLRGNKAILEHARNGKTLHLFENTIKAHVRYIGTAEYLGHHEEPRRDTNGYMRSAIVFHLDVDSTDPASNQAIGDFVPDKSISLDDLTLRQLREAATSGTSTSSTRSERNRRIYVRSEALKRYVLARSNGICESCNTDAPFITKKGKPFLECHHVNRVADGGPDIPENVIAVCPNCHRHAHYAKDARQFNDVLKKLAQSKEAQFQTAQ